MIQGLHCWEKLDASHSQGLKGWPIQGQPDRFSTQWKISFDTQVILISFWRDLAFILTGYNNVELLFQKPLNKHVLLDLMLFKNWIPVVWIETSYCSMKKTCFTIFEIFFRWERSHVSLWRPCTIYTLIGFFTEIWNLKIFFLEKVVWWNCVILGM